MAAAESFPAAPMDAGDRTLMDLMKAMKQWTFKPGTKDGQSVPVSIQVEMTFTLK